MFAAMTESGAAARPDAVAEDGWYPAAAEAFQQQLADGSLAACVLDDRDADRLVGCAVAQLVHRLPGPGFSSGLAGSVSSVYVEPDHRGRGHARVMTVAVLDWLYQAGAEVVDLHATPDSEALYRSLGFTEPASRAMRRLRPSSPPG